MLNNYWPRPRKCILQTSFFAELWELPRGFAKLHYSDAFNPARAVPLREAEN